VWDTYTGETLHTLQHAHIVRAVAFPPHNNPQILATGGVEKKLRIFDLSRADPVPEAATPPANGANGFPTPSNGATTAPSYEIGEGVHEGTIRSILWTPDSNILVTAAEDKKLRWWDLRTKAMIGEFELEGTLGSCEIDPIPLRESASGNGTLSVAAGKTVYFFEADRPAQLIKSINVGHDVASVALHGRERKFVTGAVGDTWVRVWDYDSGTEIEMGKGHHGPIWACAFSPDGKLYATGSEDGTIKLWKFTTGAYGLWK
jgi:serine-threonine kinase receptor-associated protein